MAGDPPPANPARKELPGGTEDEHGNYVPDSGNENKIFNGVFYHIVTGPALSEAKAAELRPKLNDNGANELEPTSSKTKIDFEVATHIISADIDFPGYKEAERLMIPVVKPEWVDASIERQRLAQVRPYNPDPRFFFAGVVASIADLPQGDKEAICGGIIAMGGQCSHAISKFNTHIVALNMDNKKCQHALAKKMKVKFVLPHWFDDCLKLERRIDEAPYLLPNPPIEREDPDEKVELPRGPDLTYSHSHPTTANGQKPPSIPKEGIKILQKKRIYFGQDLELSDRMKGVLIDLVTRSDGTVVTDLGSADVYIGHFRDGHEYIRAHQKEIYVGNLTWLYWMFAHREWTNPLSRLLHYPLPRNGLPGMTDYRITVSNYGGDARLYLENLIQALGATFTKSMKVDNTHLITARAHSEKWNAAKEWNIHAVNHLWLEETYSKWEVQTLTNPKYTHFPLRTNLMEVVGQTSLKEEALKQFYEVPVADRMDIDRSEDSPLSDMEDAPAPVVLKKSDTNTKQNAPKTVAKKPSVEPARTKTVQTPAKPANVDLPAPLSTGRRAKQAAEQLLRDQSVDIALFQKEQKRKGGVLGVGRKRRSSVETIEPPESRKRTASPQVTDGAKKIKKRPKPSVYLLITGYKNWVDAPDKEDAEKKILADIGIKCVTDPDKCTHLAAPHVVRTEKFLLALSRAPTIISTAWVEACIAESRIVDTTPYLLKDAAGEKKFNVNLSESLALARENKGQLLSGQAVYCAPGVRGGFEVCKRIVEANGGVCILLTPRVNKKPANAPDCERMVLLSEDNTGDRALWSLFAKMAVQQRSECLVYRSDWLLDLAMRQRIEWGEKYNVDKK